MTEKEFLELYRVRLNEMISDYKQNINDSVPMHLIIQFISLIQEEIFAERVRTGLNDTHGFRAYYYGTGTVKAAPRYC